MELEDAAAQAGLDMLDSADWPAISILSGMIDSFECAEFDIED